MRNTSKRKSECTPEEWAAHLAYHRSRRLARVEAERERLREYTQRPDVKQRRRERDARPEAVAKRRAYAQTAKAKERAAELVRLRRADTARHEARLSGQRKRRTGLSNNDVLALLALQGNKCAVCQRDFNGRQVRADHCHDSGVGRGLLCHHCNIIEGMLRGMQVKPEAFAERLVKYLAHPPARLLDDPRFGV